MFSGSLDGITDIFWNVHLGLLLSVNFIFSGVYFEWCRVSIEIIM